LKNGFAELKGTKVYLQNADMPWGILADFAIDEKSGRVMGAVVKTVSIIPVTGIVKLSDMRLIKGKRLEINDISLFETFGRFSKEKRVLKMDKIKGIILSGSLIKRIKNIHFDMETGEICDAVVVKNIIAGKQTVLINKISLKDNTIYAENFKEEE